MIRNAIIALTVILGSIAAASVQQLPGDIVESPYVVGSIALTLLGSVAYTMRWLMKQVEDGRAATERAIREFITANQALASGVQEVMHEMSAGIDSARKEHERAAQMHEQMMRLTEASLRDHQDIMRALGERT